MRWIGWAALATVVIVLSVPNGPVQALRVSTLYDDFHGAQIDPDLWAAAFAFGYEKSLGLDQTVARLKMAVQAHGNVGSGPLVFGAGRVNLPMVIASAAAAKGIQVTAQIEDVNVTGCGSPGPGRALAGLNANFFRDGPNPTNPNDNTNIVDAGIRLVVLANQPDQTIVRVFFFAERCLDFNCDTAFDLGGGAFPDVAVGVDATLGMELDMPNNRIIFTKDGATQFVNNVSANQFNFNLGPLHIKQVVERIHLETCPTRAQGSITASFENFMTTP